LKKKGGEQNPPPLKKGGETKPPPLKKGESNARGQRGIYKKDVFLT
jgi:hypothetical protein